jgi:EAL domain-containing protein (putative c-di-GMP-specific phosphodiesterase class I)
MDNQKPNLLIVDDDPHVLRSYREAMLRAGCTVQTASNGRAALDRVAGVRFDAIVSDVAMPHMNGLEFLRSVRQRDIDVPVILVTGDPRIEEATRAVEYGAFRFLVKPVELKRLDEAVRQAVRFRRLSRLKRDAGDLSGGGTGGVAVTRQFVDRAGLEVHFESAVDRLWMAYQPVVCWREKTTFGYEALVRSSEPRMPNPSEILDAAARLDRITELGRAVRDQIATDMEDAPSDACILVNLHPTDLEDDTLCDPESPLGKRAARVVLEVTERAALYTVSNVSKRVAALRKMGYRIAIDDLGAGYAGLASFTVLEPEIAKIDMSLVRGIDTDSRRQAIVKSLLALCGELGATALAEGVETKSECDALVSLGCNVFQGYFFAKPGRGFAAPSLGPAA